MWELKPLTCSRKVIGKRHISHSSSGTEGKAFWLSHAGLPPTLLGNCRGKSRHCFASSRKPRTTSDGVKLLAFAIVGNSFCQ